jgi:HPt (histidine-containing phosphotransfer) domain-containing protein
MILAEDAGDGVAQRFIEEFLDLLPARVSRVVRCLSSSDLAASRDAVVSLRVTSAMAGALRMEHYCRQLEDALANRALPDAAAVLLGMSKTSRLILHEAGRAWPSARFAGSDLPSLHPS